jgi:molybdenum cofactor biosynthesis protein B
MTDSPKQPAASVDEHRAAAPRSVGVAVLTMSDTRTRETDASGALIRELLNITGHTLVDYQIVPDEPEQIRAALVAWTDNPDVQAILTNGGTGITARDSTYEVVSGLLEKRLDGFGELFRMLSYQEIGPAAMLSRAVAGVYRGRLIMTMPGSRNAVQLAMTKLIAPELGHLVYEVTK